MTATWGSNPRTGRSCAAGLIGLLKRTGGSPYWANLTAAYAVAARDFPLANTLFDRIGDDCVVSAWSGEWGNFERARNEALSHHTTPLSDVPRIAPQAIPIGVESRFPRLPHVVRTSSMRA